MAKKLPKFINENQVVKLLDQINEDCATGARNKAILMIMYRADYADDNFEIIRASTDDEALREAWDMEKEHERLFNLFEVDEDFEEIRTIV